MKGRRVRLVIVDDHPMVRQGLAAIASLADELDVVGEAEDLENAVSAVRSLRPDVVLLDLVLPGAHGAQSVARIAEAWDGARILVLTSFGEPERVREALEAGAAGFLLKTVAPEDLLLAVRQVAGGHSVVGHDLQAATRSAPRRLPTGESLTARELQVLRLLSDGLDNREISVRFGIAEKTVKVHVGRICGKLRVHGRAQALVQAAREGLVTIAREP